MKLDLSSAASVREFSEEFRRLSLPLHLLVCNASIMTSGLTAEKLDIIFGVSHFGHALLFQCMLPHLRRAAQELSAAGAAAQQQPSVRVVVVASESHYSGNPKRFEALWEGKNTSSIMNT